MYFYIQNKGVKEHSSASSKSKKVEITKIVNQKARVLEKTKSQEKKLKDSIDQDPQTNLKKNNSEDSLVNQINNELINVEMGAIKNSDLEFTVKSDDEEIKNIVDNSLKIE